MDIELMKMLAKTNPQKLLQILHKYLKSNGYKLFTTNDYILATGNLPIALVAHLDTVSSFPPVDIFYDSTENVMWSPDLLGADDRAGVYAIIKLIQQGYKPHIIFTTGEEIGGIGARALTAKKPKCPWKNLKAIIELDRHGEDDCVFYDCDNPKFTKYIESFGFVKAEGSFTDISILCPQWGVAGVNLSVGYYNEHSTSEHLYMNKLEKTIERVGKILDNAKTMDKYKYIERERLWEKCACCGNWVFPGTGHITQTADYRFAMCDDCYITYVVKAN